MQAMYAYQPTHATHYIATHTVTDYSSQFKTVMLHLQNHTFTTYSNKLRYTIDIVGIFSYSVCSSISISFLWLYLVSTSISLICSSQVTFYAHFSAMTHRLRPIISSKYRRNYYSAYHLSVRERFGFLIKNYFVDLKTALAADVIL